MADKTPKNSGLYHEVSKRVDEWLDVHKGETFNLDEVCRQLEIASSEARKEAATKLNNEVSKGKLEKDNKTYRYINTSISTIEWANANVADSVELLWPYGIEDNTHFGFDGHIIIPQRSLIVLAGVSNTGKGHPYGTPILTKSGWINIENLKVGDDVFGKDGHTHKVTGIFPRGIQKCYRFIFNDKTYVDVDEGHLWTIRKTWGRKTFNWLTKSVTEIINTYGFFDKNAKTRIEIPMCQPLNFPRRPVPLSPYLIGLLIGDGYLIESPKFSTDSPIMIDAFIQNGFEIGAHHSYDYTILGLKDVIRDLGLDKLSQDKFIPEIYKFNSTDVRLAILRGLMDTDGSVDKNGYCCFDSVSQKLVEDIRFLIQSLGGRTAFSTKSASTYKLNGEKHLCQKVYRLYFKLDINPFTLKSKAERWQPGLKSANRRIKHISPIGEHETICISVDSPDGLYLTKDCIVTHNTAFALNFLWMNMDTYPCTLMGNEYEGSQFKRRVSYMKFREPLDNDNRPKFELIERHDNWKDIIRPDGINIIDWINLGDNFYNIGKINEGIKERLNKGVALILIQKDAGKAYGMGGMWGSHLATLYMTMDYGRLTVEKCKEYNGHNPNREMYGFDITNHGTQFYNIRSVVLCRKCWGKTNNTKCELCNGRGYMDAENNTCEVRDF